MSQLSTLAHSTLARGMVIAIDGPAGPANPQLPAPPPRRSVSLPRLGAMYRSVALAGLEAGATSRMPP